MERKLKEILENVQDTYADFVEYVLWLCKTDDSRKDMIDFIMSTEDVNTSKIIEHTDEYAKV